MSFLRTSIKPVVISTSDHRVKKVFFYSLAVLFFDVPSHLCLSVCLSVEGTVCQSVMTSCNAVSTGLMELSSFFYGKSFLSLICKCQRTYGRGRTQKKMVQLVGEVGRKNLQDPVFQFVSNRKKRPRNKKIEIKRLKQKPNKKKEETKENKNNDHPHCKN